MRGFVPLNPAETRCFVALLAHDWRTARPLLGWFRELGALSRGLSRVEGLWIKVLFRLEQE